MADPPTGPPEPLPTRNTRQSAVIDAPENPEPRNAPRTRRQTRLEEDNAHANSFSAETDNSGTNNGRVTTKEIRQIIDHLQHTINKQTALIQATRTELREVKNNQGELQAQNETLREVPLRDLFSTSTTPSRANRTRVLGISRLEVLKSLAERFQDFETDPLDFWERLSKALPQYAKYGPENRAKIFLEGAVQLDTNIQEQLILQRFVSVASYKLFRRAIPASDTRIMPESLKRFLIHVGICS